MRSNKNRKIEFLKTLEKNYPHFGNEKKKSNFVDYWYYCNSYNSVALG